MLDIGGATSLPPTIVVGRTLSAYDVPDVQNNQETLTFTVYNQAADPLTGVLLTDTLESGVRFANASRSPDQNGIQLAWSLGTIQPYDRASVTLTVSLANPIPTTLDTGASAYGTLDAGMVTWTTAPATLRTTAIADNLLASTPDANTTDPYVREEAAQLGYDPEHIFNFLHNSIDYNAYVGSVRGARGTLWSSAGNSLDVASLGVALMRASGIPAQYAQGTLPPSGAQQLILSMFPASYQTLGYIPPGSQTADPVDNPQLLSMTEDHYWFQFDSGSGMQDADPLVAGATIGQKFATSSGAFAQVPENLREKTELQLVAEITNTANSFFALSSQQDTTVLDQTFDDVDLVGKPITIGNFESSTTIAATVSRTTNNYTPFLDLGDDAYSDRSQDQVITGASYQEVLTNFPFGSQVLTGLFLNITLSGPQGPSETFERTLADRIGYVARQSGEAVNVNVSPGSAPLVGPLDFWSVAVQASLQDPTAAASLDSAMSAAYGALASQITAEADDSALVSAARNVFIAQTRSDVAALLTDSDSATGPLAVESLVAAYFSRPRISIVSSAFRTNASGETVIAFETDLRNDSISAFAAPGQLTTATASFLFARGLSESVVESLLLPNVPASSNSVSSSNVGQASVFQAAQKQDIALVKIDATNASEVDSLEISLEAKARITAAVQTGLTVIVPARTVTVSGAPAIAWLEVNSATGEATGVTEDGGHADLVEIGAYALFVDVTLSLLLREFLVALGRQFAADEFKPQLIYDNAYLRYTAVDDEAKAKALQAVYDEYKALFDSAESKYIAPSFVFGYQLQLTVIYNSFVYTPRAGDPAIAPGLLEQPRPILATNNGIIGGSLTANLAAGTLQGNVSTRFTRATGKLAAVWAGADSTAFAAASLTSASAIVVGPSGAVVGSGSLSLAPLNATTITVSGNVDYSVHGVGNLSFYSPAAKQLAVSGDWSSYSADVNGAVTLTLTTAGLTLNGQSLPDGTYTITTNAASLVGSGQSASPDFAGMASVTASDGALVVGNGSGSLQMAGSSLNPANETTLDGYSGNVIVRANGDGTEAVQLTGSGTNAITLAPATTTFTTDQNTPVTFAANVRTSLSDTYSYVASGPTGWTISVDQNGNVTVLPAPGSPAGAYPIRVLAISSIDPNLTAQVTLTVNVTATAQGMTLAVLPDIFFSVPFQGSEVPSTFQAHIDNTGPSADTYHLTFSNVPNGFTILSSGTTDSVPAGQTGMVGMYLQPTGAQLPPPGTNLSFNVTATSVTNAAITRTVNVSFTMPTVDAVTVAATPTSLSSTPGSPTAATVTITNVGNVPANAALSTTTDNGLTASGLPSAPVSVGIGQSTRETITLTPAGSVALNSTLTATVNAGLAAAQSEVRVVSVGAALAGVGGTSAPQSFAPGETVDVTADILGGVLQPRQALASYTVTNSAGTTVFTSSPVTIALGALPADNLVDLGTLSTTGLASGRYTINVSVRETNGQAIAGATGTVTLLINSPVTPGLSVDAEQVSPGTNTVTTTLTVANQPVLGSVQTDGTASRVAVNGTLAYVAGTKDINVVDISHANPQIVGTFGSGKLNSSGTNFVQVSGSDLVVATHDQTNSNTFDVLVYTLADPKNPQFAGSVTVPYASLAGMTVQGTTAYFTTNGITYDPSSGSITDQYGDAAAVDFSNPAAPQFLGVLFNDRGSPVGHSGEENDVVPITGGLAYVAGSTSTGPDAQTGTGRVLIVGTHTTSPPESVGATLGELDLPGTVQALAIAVDGNTALVVGSSGGQLSPFGAPSNEQFTGNVTLTLLDISNPANPKIIGSTVNTQDTFDTSGDLPSGVIQAITLGNGQFAVSGTLLNGAPVVLAVDASTPTNPGISTYGVNSPVNGLAMSGGELLATSANGLQVLQANALTTTSLTAEVAVPNTSVNFASFSTPPTQVVPGTNTTELIWDIRLAPGDNQQITWLSTTSDLLPGQVEQLASGASVQFTESGTNESITLPALNVVAIAAPQSVQIPLVVRSARTVAISQASIDAADAGNSQLSGTLSELADTISQLQASPTDPNLLSRTQLLLNNLAPELAADPALAQLTATLTLMQNAVAARNVTALLATTPAFFTTADQALSVEATEQFIASLSPGEVDLQAQVNQQKSLSVQLTDTGSNPETLTLSTGALPNGVTAALGQTQITLQPGATQTVPLTLTSNLTSTSVFTLDVHVADNTDSKTTTVAHDATAMIAVRPAAADVLGVTVNPVTATAGTPIAVSASIFNTANATRNVEAQLTVLDSSNKPVGLPVDVPITLTPAASAVTFPLGNVPTVGLASGVYTLEVSLLASDGSALPGRAGEAPFLVGVPVTASVSANATTLPPGSSNVTTTITVTNADPPNAAPAPQAASAPNAVPAPNVASSPPATGASGPGTVGSTVSSIEGQTVSPQVPNLSGPPPVNTEQSRTTDSPPQRVGATEMVGATMATSDDAMEWLGTASDNWDNAANWLDTTTNTNRVPGSRDAVTISTSAALTITIQSSDSISVLSLTTGSNDTLAIAGGSLTVTSGTSTLAGPLSMTGGSLAASGSGTSLTTSGATTISSASLFASNGATLALPTLLSYSEAPSAEPKWQASGGGSVLSLSGLTTVAADTTGPNGQFSLIVINALSGGHIGLGNVTGLSGPVQVTSDGTSSQVDLSKAASFQGSSNFTAGPLLQATNSGTLLDGALKTPNDVTVKLDGTGTLATSQWTTATNCKLEISGGTPDLGNLASATSSSFFVSGGATLALPAVTSYSETPGAQPTWQASGGSSVLSLPGLTTVAADTTGQFSLIVINALSGGHIDLRNVTGLSGPVQVTSDGTNSRVDLSKAASFLGSSNFTAGPLLQATNSGTLLDGALTTLNDVTVKLDGTGTLATSQWTLATNSTLEVSGGIPDFGNLADVMSSSFFASGGATLALPAVKTYSETPSAEPKWQASGGGSVLSLPDLTTVAADTTGPTGQFSLIVINALSGGHIDLRNVTGLSGPVQVTSDGTSSQVDLSKAASFQGSSNFTAGPLLQATNSGAVLDGALTTLNDLRVVTDGTDPQLASSWTNANIPSLQLLNGGTLSFPLLTAGGIPLTNGQTVTIQGTVVSMPADGASGATINLPPSQSLIVILNNAGTFSGTTTLNVGQGTSAVLSGGTYSGMLVGSGQGALELTGGTWNVASGGLSLNFPGSLFQWSGGTINASQGDLTNVGAINITGNSQEQVSGNLNNSGTVAKAAGSGTSTLDVTGTLNNTGTIEADAGTFVLEAGGVPQISGNNLTAGTWNALDGATLELPSGTNVTANAADITLGGLGAALDGIANLATNGGSFTVTAGGTFATAGGFTNSGSLTLGPGGALFVSGNFTQTSAGALNEQLSGTTATNLFGQAVITSAANLAGSFQVVLVNGYQPPDNRVFPVLTYTSASGSFATIGGLTPGMTATQGTTAFDLVTPADLVENGEALSIAPTADVAFSGTVATFTGSDPNGTAADFTATIDWGDGTTTIGTITGTAAGGYSVVGSHTYAEQATALPMKIDIVQFNLPNPLTLDGQVATTPTGTNVTLYQDAMHQLAYVVGTNGLDIVDISNPADPVDEGTFGGNVIVKGGLTVGRVDEIGGANYLLVGTTIQNSSGAVPFDLLVYSLSNPLSPQLVSNTPFQNNSLNGTPFISGFLGEMAVEGTTVLVPTFAYHFILGVFIGQQGNVLAIDVSNPAAPQLDGVLFPGASNPDAQTTQISATIVNSHIAYIASSTATGGSTQNGVGRVLVVDFSDPNNLEVLAQIDVPNTYQIEDVGVQGDRALLVGRTGGTSDNSVNGSMTLSVLDISDPANPKLLGTTLVTKAGFSPALKISALQIGAGQFVVSEAAENGVGMLLRADINDPNNIVVATDRVPASVNEMAVAGNLLYTTSSAGLLIYNIGNLTTIGNPTNVAPFQGTLVTVNHQIPSTGYNVDPTSITPAPTSSSSTALTWQTVFTPVQTQSQQFQLTGQVTDMAPGEVREISQGTTVTATIVAAGGTQIPVSIQLPPLTVAAQHIIELTPPTQSVDQGATANYSVEVSNPLPTDETYTLSVAGLPAGENASLAASVPVPAGQTVDVPLTISVPLGALQGTQPFLVFAQTAAGASDSVEGQLTVNSTVAISPLAVNLTLMPTQATAGQSNPATYTLTVTNTGDTTDTYNLTASLPQGFTGTFSQTTVTMPPGIGNFREVQFSITPPAGAAAQSYPFTVTATSTTDGTVSSQAGGTVTVAAAGVEVQLTPSSAAPGSTYQLKVTNTGQAADTFNLSLASPGALVSTLGTNQVALQPGASQTVSVTTSAVNFTDAGTLPLTGVATSQTDSSVRGQSTADLTISSTQSMTAAFNPAQQMLAIPGMTSFLLDVNNTGNTQDSYLAKIVGTTGPVTANLVALDGQPTQSLPLFILPGLSTGAILLQVDDTATGQGTVSVLVQSLTDSSIQATPIATITVPATPPSQLTLTNNTGLAVAEGSSTALTTAMLLSADSNSSVTPANIVYTLTSAPTQGSLLLNRQGLAAGGTFTQDDINNGRLAYKATEEGADSFGFHVTASGATGISGAFLVATLDPAVVATGGFTYTATEGTTATAQTVAVFTDPGGAEVVADYSATIDWGDGTTATAGTLALGSTDNFTVTGQHSYANDGTYTVEVTLTHESAPAVTVTSAAQVANASTSGRGGIAATASTVSGYEFSMLTGVTVATFTDRDGSLPATDFSASIDWGDGVTSAGSIALSAGTYTVTGSHQYTDEGHYAANVTIVQTAGLTTAGATSATVGALATIHEQLLENGTLGTPDQKWVQEVYRDVFDRQAETQGLNYWVAELTQAVPRQQVAYEMIKLSSFEEFQYDTVAALYQQYLGRAPDPAGDAYWVAYLYDGGTIENMSEALVSSPEYLRRAGGTDEFLASLFQDALGREIDPNALAYFQQQMAQGASAADVAAAVFSSDEYHRVRVDALFEQFLGRAGDPGALDYFAGELDNGAKDELVISQLMSSSEYYENAHV